MSSEKKQNDLETISDGVTILELPDTKDIVACITCNYNCNTIKCNDVKSDSISVKIKDIDCCYIKSMLFIKKKNGDVVQVEYSSRSVASQAIEKLAHEIYRK